MQLVWGSLISVCGLSPVSFWFIKKKQSTQNCKALRGFSGSLQAACFFSFLSFPLQQYFLPVYPNKAILYF